ncbi:MAG: hypothetical protein VW405_02920, partial [Rhodospirillaceae bacterium]
MARAAYDSTVAFTNGIVLRADDLNTLRDNQDVTVLEKAHALACFGDSEPVVLQAGIASADINGNSNNTYEFQIPYVTTQGALYSKKVTGGTVWEPDDVVVVGQVVGRNTSNSYPPATSLPGAICKLYMDAQNNAIICRLYNVGNEVTTAYYFVHYIAIGIGSRSFYAGTWTDMSADDAAHYDQADVAGTDLEARLQSLQDRTEHMTNAALYGHARYLSTNYDLTTGATPTGGLQRGSESKTGTSTEMDFDQVTLATGADVGFESATTYFPHVSVCAGRGTQWRDQAAVFS